MLGICDVILGFGKAMTEVHFVVLIGVSSFYSKLLKFKMTNSEFF
jgi:hypothetical protein